MFMLCFLKRVLPFTLTLLVGLAIGGLFNLWKTETTETRGEYRLQTSFGAEGRGCRSRRFGNNYSFNSYSPATILSESEASYTTEARRNQTEGQVILRVTLGADGNVGDIETITSLPDGLTEQARIAARQIKFIPAVRNGYKVDETKTITYTFNLD
jgi:TonB family protein